MITRKKYIRELEADICKGLLQTLDEDHRLNAEIFETNNGGLRIEDDNIVEAKVCSLGAKLILSKKGLNTMKNAYFAAKIYERKRITYCLTTASTHFISGAPKREQNI